MEDRTIRFERRYAGGYSQRMSANIAEIVSLRPDVILAQNTPMVAALRRQTDSIPIVFVQVSDPVGDGFVESLAHPGGNATGFTNTMSSLGGKWVELLKEAAPGVSQLGYLFNRAAAPGAGAYYLEPLLTAAAALGMKAVQLELRNVDEIDSVIAGFAAAGGNGMVANSDSFITVNRNRIIAAANRLRLPTIYSSAQNTNSGGLISYGADLEQGTPQRAMSTASCAAQSPATCQCSPLPSSYCRSTSKPRRRLASTYPGSSSSAPTR
jgi:ABC-type uncharacterized transport system substrate-binding protein